MGVRDIVIQIYVVMYDIDDNERKIKMWPNYVDSIRNFLLFVMLCLIVFFINAMESLSKTALDAGFGHITSKALVEVLHKCVSFLKSNKINSNTEGVCSLV